MRKPVTAILRLTLMATSLSVAADTFRLKNGETVEGELLETVEGRHRIRTPAGKVVLLPVSQVAERVKTPSPQERYEAARARHPDTAAGHVALARWCAENGLPAQWTEHLHRALALEPGYEPALVELGWVHIGDAWLKTGKPPPATAAEAARKAEEKRQEEAELLRNALSDWIVRVRAIYGAHLVLGGRPASRESMEEGLNKLAAIREPLAIPALAEVLAVRHGVIRHMLVHLLSRFKEDEALLNLVALAILDPDQSVRDRAAATLARRNDPRVTEQLVEALASREEEVLLNAARALAPMKDLSTVPPLIKVLKSRPPGDDALTRDELIRGLLDRFGQPRIESIEGRDISYQPQVRVLGRGSPVGELGPTKTRSTYRSDVQEALIDITGVNHGFDEQAWTLWYLQNAQQEQGQN